MEILSLLSRFYYCLAISVITSVIAFVISIRYYNRHKELRIFTYYILVSIVSDLAGVYRYISGDKLRPRIIAGVVDNIFMLTEFIVCTYFMTAYISSVKRRMAVKILSLLFISILLFFWIKIPRTIYMDFFSLESLFLVPTCLFYFYELFTQIYNEPLKNQPAFWITTGILFLNASSLPLFLTIGMLGKYHEEAFSLNYILYTLFFLLIIRAYLCKPELKTA